MLSNKLKRLVAATLAGILTFQPVLAATYQYNVYVKGFQPQQPQAGTGIGDIDPGDDPTAPVPPKVPSSSLALSVETLTYDASPNAATESQRTLLTNYGNASADLSGLIVSDANFNVSSDCPEQLVPNAACTITASFDQRGQGSAKYSLPLEAHEDAAPVVLSLVAVKPTTNVYVRLRAKSDMVDLGELAPGAEGTGTATLVNEGSLAAKLSGITSANGFTIASDCPSVLEPQTTCTVSSSFKSYAPGQAAASLAIAGDDSGNTAPLTFYARVISDPAMSPKLTVDSALLRFGPLESGQSSVKKVVLSNKGTTPATLLALTGSSDFKVSSDCGATLDPNQACQITATYTAKEGRSVPAHKLDIKSREGSNTEVMLEGQLVTSEDSSLAKLSFSSDSVDFSNSNVGVIVTKALTLTNTGPEDAQLKGISVEYDYQGVFTQTNNCPTLLASGASCSLTVKFKPTSIYASSARLKALADKNIIAAAMLSGQGVAANLEASVPTVNFGAITDLKSRPSRVITFGNSGNVPVSGLKITAHGERVGLYDIGCSDTLAPRQSCSVTIGVTPSNLGDITGSVVATSSNSSAATVSVSGAAVALQAAPSALNFTDTRVDATALTQEVSLTNNGPTAVSLQAVSISEGITEFGQSNNCGTSLASGSSCTISVLYSPALEGTRTGILAVVSQGAVVASVTLSGVASAPNLTLTPESLNFLDTNVGQSRTETLVVRNPTSGIVEISEMGIASGEASFGQANNCATHLEPGQTCNVSIKASVTAEGRMVGSWALKSSLGTKQVALSIVGANAKAEFEDPTGDGSGDTPTYPGDGFIHYAIKFLDTEYGMSSAVRNIKFSNSGNGPLTVKGISVVKGIGDFGQSNNCGSVLAAGTSCTIALLFTPSEVGSRTGGVVVDSDNGKFYFDLTGTGIAAQAKWSGLPDFGMVPAGQVVRRTFTLTNVGSVAAHKVVTNLSASGLNLLSNACGTASKPLEMAPSATCAVVVEYSPTVQGSTLEATLNASGSWFGKTSLGILGMSPAPGLAFDTAGSDFGSFTVGVPVSKTFTLTNTAPLTDTLASTPVVSGEGFVRTGGTCVDGLALASNTTCTVIVTLTPTEAGTQTGIVSAKSAKGAGAALPFSGTAIQSVYVISGAAMSTTAPETNFGTLSTTTPTVYKDYFLRDDKVVAAVYAKKVTLTGAPSFSVASIDVFGGPGYMVDYCAYDTKGSTATCGLGWGTGTAIHVKVALSNLQKGENNATLRFEHNGTGGFTEVVLSATGLYDVTAKAVESGNGFNVLPVRDVNPDFGKIAFGSPDNSTGAPVTKTIMMQTTGSRGKLGVTAKLEGVNDFKITGVGKVDPNKYLAPGGIEDCGAAVSGDSLSTSQCLSDDVAGGGYTYTYVNITFTPKGNGLRNSKLTLTHTGDNSPNPVVIPLTGTAVYDVSAEAVEANGGFYAWDVKAINSSLGDVSFGSPDGSSGVVRKTFIIKNNGTIGKLGVTPHLTGVDDYKITGVYKLAAERYLENIEGCGAQINGTGTASSLCVSDDIAGGAYKWLRVDIAFTPKVLGERKATLTLEHSGINTPNPVVIPLTATAVYNAKAEVVEANGGFYAWDVKPVNESFGSTTSGVGILRKTLIIKNTGTLGKLGVTPKLEGLSDYRITAVYKLQPDDYLERVDYCGSQINAEGTEATQCLSDEATTGRYRWIRIDLQFTPKAVGTRNAQIKLLHSGTNKPNPAIIALTGTGT